MQASSVPRVLFEHFQGIDELAAASRGRCVKDFPTLVPELTKIAGGDGHAISMAWAKAAVTDSVKIPVIHDEARSEQASQPPRRRLFAAKTASRDPQRPKPGRSPRLADQTAAGHSLVNPASRRKYRPFDPSRRAAAVYAWVFRGRPLRCRRPRAFPRGRSLLRRPNRKRIAPMAMPDLHHAPAARGRRAFRPSHAALEPEDGALHLRRRATASTSSISSRRCRCCTRALQAIRDVVAGGGRVLFVGTKRQAQEPIAEAAKRCGQYYVNHRWLGGMLTNFKTISHVDQAAARARRAHRQRADRPDQARTARADPRPRQARAGAGRHQGDGRPARHPVHHRHQQGSDRGRRKRTS